jgi:hypothetical protein
MSDLNYPSNPLLSMPSVKNAGIIHCPISDRIDRSSYQGRELEAQSEAWLDELLSRILL